MYYVLFWMTGLENNLVNSPASFTTSQAVVDWFGWPRVSRKMWKNCGTIIVFKSSNIMVDVPHLC